MQNVYEWVLQNTEDYCKVDCSISFIITHQFQLIVVEHVEKDYVVSQTVPLLAEISFPCSYPLVVPQLL